MAKRSVDLRGSARLDFILVISRQQLLQHVYILSFVRVYDSREDYIHVDNLEFHSHCGSRTDNLIEIGENNVQNRFGYCNNVVG